MTIDPNKFDAQGLPKPEQIRAIWDELGRPSVNEVHKVLEQRGFSITYRSVARHISRWRLQEGETRPTGTKPLREQAAENGGMRKQLKRALKGVNPETVRKAEEMKAKGIMPTIAKDISGPSQGQKSTDRVDLEEAIIATRIAQLQVLSEAELDLIEQKSRKMLNIILTEAAARRGNVLVLIPKDIAALVDSMTEASKQTLTGGLDQPPKAGDPRVIDGEAIEVEPDPPTPLASAIAGFLKNEGLVN
jgi:hypothetical protein